MSQFNKPQNNSKRERHIRKQVMKDYKEEYERAKEIHGGKLSFKEIPTYLRKAVEK